MVLINEIFPNPAGKDSNKEFVELINTGNSPANLSGYTITNHAGKKYNLSGTLGSGGILLLPYKQIKISLKNSDEVISLYFPDGTLADRASFNGEAKEGVSLARNGAVFVFTKNSTPGSANKFTSIFQIDKDLNFLNIGSKIHPTISSLELSLIIITVGLAFVFLTGKLYEEQLN